ncbi:hypothetical protein ACFOS0_15470 [Nocardia seriolae]|uniref:hypothetical protein n=1 Tax=Nocardia seriolae TaxID=37332 RepID=UPI001194FFB8|nr:hypothetical protein [Nocardia seriolae]GEM26884.1 hypothetical protein NS2_51230 [Nocardia seriolae NBRC 15557]
MTSGNDPGNEPGRAAPNPEWWQGTPEQQPTWQQPQQPWQPTTPMPGPYPAPPQYPPGYGGQPPYPPPPGGGKRRVWLFAGLAALVVAVIAAVVIVALVNKNSAEPSAQSTTTPSLISALTSTTTKPGGSAKPTPTKTSAAKPTSTPAAVIPGYQVVTIPNFGAVYDIPPTWKVDRSGQNAFGTGADVVVAAGLAQDGVDYCPKNVRTNVFLTQSDESDPAKAAVDIGTRLGRIGWSTASGATPGATESFQSTDGQLQGVYLETRGNAQPAAGCASTFSVYTFAFPGESGAFVFTIAADTGVDQAVDPAMAKKILGSLRPIQ